MSKELSLVNVDNILTPVEVATIDREIDRVIESHKNNRSEINRLTFECVSALGQADMAHHKLSSKGWFKRLCGSITGSNRRLQNEINAYQAAAQYASQRTIEKLAEQNLLTFDLLVAVNNKLNASMVAVEQEFNAIYDGLRKFVAYTESNLVQLSLRMDQLEQNVNLLNWQASIEYLMFNDVEYGNLSTTEKIVCMTRDFYDITKGKWETKELLLLKSAMGTIGLTPNAKVNYFDTLLEIYKNPSLCTHLIGQDKKLLSNVDPTFLLSLSTLSKLKSLDSEEQYILATLKRFLPQESTDSLKNNVLLDYMKQEASVNLDVEVSQYEFILDLLFNLVQGKEEKWVVNLSGNESVDYYYIQALGTHDRVLIEGYEKLISNPEDSLWDLYNERCSIYYKYIVRLNDIGATWYIKAAELGDMKAKQALAFCYVTGHTIKKDVEKAFELFIECANEGMSNSCIEVGFLCLGTYGIDKDFDKSMEYYEKAYMLGNGEAANNLGNCYYYGKGVEQSYEKAVDWYRKGIELGSGWAANNLGNRYYNGEGVEQSYKKAVEWYRKGIELGSGWAANYLGNCYYNGEGVEQSYEKAVEWYKKGIELGDDSAANNLGVLYAVGNGVEQSYEKANEFYRMAVESGNSVAANNLGNNYFNGRGVEQSYQIAVEWYKKGVELGNGWAAYNLGDCYKNGQGVECDYIEARRLYELALELGVEEAREKIRVPKKEWNPFLSHI